MNEKGIDNINSKRNKIPMAAVIIKRQND